MCAVCRVFVESVRACACVSNHTVIEVIGNSGKNDEEIKWHFCVHSTYECSCICVICMFCAVNVPSIVFVVLLRCGTAAIYSATSFSSGFLFSSLRWWYMLSVSQYFPVLCVDSHTWVSLCLSLCLSIHRRPPFVPFALSESPATEGNLATDFSSIDDDVRIHLLVQLRTISPLHYDADGC